MKVVIRNRTSICDTCEDHDCSTCEVRGSVPSDEYDEAFDQFEQFKVRLTIKTRPVPTYKCHGCGCAYDSIEEATCCPCYDELEEYYK